MLIGHTQLITSLSFDRKGLLASGSYDNTIKLWNTTTWDLITTLTQRHSKTHLHSDSKVFCLAFNTKNPQLASGSGSLDHHSINIWDANTGEVLIELFGHTGWVTSLAFDSDNHLATGSVDKTIKIWDAETGELIRTLHGHEDFVECLAFDSENLLASGSKDNTVKLWDIGTGALINNLVSHTHYVKSVAFDRTGLLASGSADKTTKLWNTATGDLVRTLYSQADDMTPIVDHEYWVDYVEHHSEEVTSVAFGRNGLLVTGAWDNATMLWNSTTGVLIGALTMTRAESLKLDFMRKVDVRLFNKNKTCKPEPEETNYSTTKKTIWVKDINLQFTTTVAPNIFVRFLMSAGDIMESMGINVRV